MSGWTHATNSRQRFEEALCNPSVSAIECDVLMSIGKSNASEPILAHPPSRESDLTVALMLQLIFAPEEGNGKENLRKHLKLDFKEISAVKPTLDLIYKSNFSNDFKNEVILNADILPGPGFDNNDPSIVSPSAFFEMCLDFIAQMKSKKSAFLFALSLGFKCNWQADELYSASRVSQMSALVHKYRLTTTKDSRIRIILALNARQLFRSLPVFDEFLRVHPESTILAWTGSGEPSIPEIQVNGIRDYYKSKKMESRIEFDCCIISE